LETFGLDRHKVWERFKVWKGTTGKALLGCMREKEEGTTGRRKPSIYTCVLILIFVITQLTCVLVLTQVLTCVLVLTQVLTCTLVLTSLM